MFQANCCGCLIDKVLVSLAVVAVIFFHLSGLAHNVTTLQSFLLSMESKSKFPLCMKVSACFTICFIVLYFYLITGFFLAMILKKRFTIPILLWHFQIHDF